MAMTEQHHTLTSPQCSPRRHLNSLLHVTTDHPEEETGREYHTLSTPPDLLSLSSPRSNMHSAKTHMILLGTVFIGALMIQVMDLKDISSISKHATFPLLRLRQQESSSSSSSSSSNHNAQPTYSILPKKIYSVIGLESSGTQFVSKIIEDALQSGPYREGSRPCIETCKDDTPYCKNMQVISKAHACNENSDTMVQHFSLPWGGRCHVDPKPPVVDVILPSQCTRDQAVDSNEYKECNAMTNDLWNFELNGKPVQYPRRYQLDIAAHKQWYDAQGVEQYFIIVIRDENISYAARRFHCEDANFRKQEEEVGTELIVNAINTFVLGDTSEKNVTSKTYKEWVAKKYQPSIASGDGGGRRRLGASLPANNNVIVISYESLVKLGSVYVRMMYDSLSIESDFIPEDIRNSNEKYLNSTS